MRLRDTRQRVNQRPSKGNTDRTTHLLCSSQSQSDSSLGLSLLLQLLLHACTCLRFGLLKRGALHRRALQLLSQLHFSLSLLRELSLHLTASLGFALHLRTRLLDLLCQRGTLSGGGVQLHTQLHLERVLRLEIGLHLDNAVRVKHIRGGQSSFAWVHNRFTNGRKHQEDVTTLG